MKTPDFRGKARKGRRARKNEIGRCFRHGQPDVEERAIERHVRQAARREIRRRMGVNIDMGGDFSKSDGTPEGDKRAAAWATVEAIVSDSTLCDAIIAKVGREQWGKTVDFFISLSQTAPAPATTPTNGVNMN